MKTKNPKNPKNPSYAPLYETLTADEIARLNNWLKGRDWVSPQSVWTQGLMFPIRDYDRANSIRTGFMLIKNFGWLRTGRRANINGERHWVYVPKGSKKYASKAHFLHASEVCIDGTEVSTWLANRTYTTTIEVLYRVFRVQMPRCMDEETLWAINEVRGILLRLGWTANSDAKRYGHEVFYRDDVTDRQSFDDILG